MALQRHRVMWTFSVNEFMILDDREIKNLTNNTHMALKVCDIPSLFYHIAWNPYYNEAQLALNGL